MNGLLPFAMKQFQQSNCFMSLLTVLKEIFVPHFGHENSRYSGSLFSGFKDFAYFHFDIRIRDDGHIFMCYVRLWAIYRVWIRNRVKELEEHITDLIFMLLAICVLDDIGLSDHY